MLLAAGLGLEPAARALEQHFSKLSIEPRRPLKEFDVYALPSFTPVPEAPAYETTDEALGTRHWVTMAFREKDAPLSTPPLAILLSYYSNPRDKVPHTPEVCFQQEGATLTGIEVVTVSTPELEPEHSRIKARRLFLSKGGGNQAVIYVFCCNGRFYASRERMRFDILMPGDKYTYFSKVEVGCPIPPGSNPQETVQRCQLLLRELLPPLLQDYFPSSAELERG
jgi:hypothetical protein